MKKIIVSVFILVFFIVVVLFIMNVDITKADSVSFANKIISMSKGSSWSKGASGVYKTNNHEYRYIGVGVNNWVKFNDDLYRVIGVFDSNTTGVSDNLVKLISSRSLGAYSRANVSKSLFVTNYYNNWEETNTKILLNDFFLNATNSYDNKECLDWSFYYFGNKTEDCSYIVGYGIKSNFRNYIQPVTWYLTGFRNSEYSKQDFYKCASDNIYGCIKSDVGNSLRKLENTKIGLMYPSDYLYASSYFSDSDTTKGYSKYYGNNNWLYNGSEWLISPIGGSFDGAFSILSDGGLSNISGSFSVYNFRSIRPTFYLKANVMYVSGDGSINSPFVISCDNCS